MIINDYIYGEYEIEKVLEELINTNEIQRLKGVYQGGASALVNEKWNVTRYEHSIGTMLLIRILKGSLEERIAGLLHDISHTAFSHVVDYALDECDESYHETIYKKVINESNIPKILKKYGYDVASILDASKWSILEKKAPKLCADRIDYTIRDLYKDEKISKIEIDNFLKSLCVVDGEIVIKSLDSSEWFVNTYYKEVAGYFMHPLNLYAYDKLAKVLKICLNNKELKKEDLLRTDKDVLEILCNSSNRNVKDIIDILNSDLNIIESDEDYDMHKTTKLRLVDPTVLINGKCELSSDFSENIKIKNLMLQEKIKKGVYIKRTN